MFAVYGIYRIPGVREKYNRKSKLLFQGNKGRYCRAGREQALEAVSAGGQDNRGSAGRRTELKKMSEHYLREKFLRTFGSSWGMSHEMYVEYYFTETCFLKISLKNELKYTTPNHVRITLSEGLNKFPGKKQLSFCHSAGDRRRGAEEISVRVISDI